MATPIRVVPLQQAIATTWPVMDRMLIFVSRSGVFINGYRISPIRLAKGVGE
jgi:hypothetical protein